MGNSNALAKAESEVHEVFGDHNYSMAAKVEFTQVMEIKVFRRFSFSNIFQENRHLST